MIQKIQCNVTSGPYFLLYCSPGFNWGVIRRLTRNTDPVGTREKAKLIWSIHIQLHSLELEPWGRYLGIALFVLVLAIPFCFFVQRQRLAKPNYLDIDFDSRLTLVTILVVFTQTSHTKIRHLPV
jgi:hypothetical protein